MATQDVIRDEVLALATAFLAERGVFPNEMTGRYREEDIVAAIRARGWDPEVRGRSGEWEVWLKDQRAETQVQYAIAADADRTSALLRALQIAASWLTTEEERVVFDEQARRFMNLSGEEFLQKWEAGELSGDDPRVIHLLMLRPRGS